MSFWDNGNVFFVHNLKIVKSGSFQFGSKPQVYFPVYDLIQAVARGFHFVQFERYILVSRKFFVIADHIRNKMVSQCMGNCKADLARIWIQR